MVQDINIPEELIDLRYSIDNIDSALIHMLSERFKCTNQVGRLKAEKNLPPVDLAREKEQIVRLHHLAEVAGLDKFFAEKFLKLVIDEVVQNHKKIKASKSRSQ